MSIIVSILYFIISFIIAFVVNLFYLFNGIVPLFWLPYVIFKICQGKYRFSAVSLCFISPIVWNIGLFILGCIFVLLNINIPIRKFFCSFGGSCGGLLALFIVLTNMFSKAACYEFTEQLQKYEK